MKIFVRNNKTTAIMENENNVKCEDTDSIRREIAQNEIIIQDYLKTARNMKVIGTLTFMVAVLFFFLANVISGSICLVMAFICLRKYNRSVGMAEVYSGITKFLKLMYRKEVSGDTGLTDFLVNTD